MIKEEIVKTCSLLLKPSFILTVFLALAAHDTASMTPPATHAAVQAQYAYVSNSGSDSISMYHVDPSSGTLIPTGTAPSGDDPQAISVTPNGQYAYVANAGSDTISAYQVDPGSGMLTPIGSAPAGDEPQAIAVSPNGQYVYVANAGSDTVSAYRVDPGSGTLTPIGSAPTGDQPSAVVVHPSGQYAYVTNEGSGSISTYRLFRETGRLMPEGPPIPAGDAPSSIDILRVQGRDGDIAVVTNRRSNTLSLFLIPRSRPRLMPVGAPVLITTGSTPTALDIAPNGVAAVTLLSHGGGGKPAQNIGAVAIFRILPTGGVTLLGLAPAGAGPTDVEVVRHVAYVTNANSNTVSVFAIMPSGMPMPLNPAPAGQSPQSVAVTP